MEITKKRMRKLIPLIALVAGSCLLAPNAQADAYLGIDGSSFTLDNTSDDDLNPRGLRLRLGLRMSEVFDLEGHFGFGYDDDTSAFDEIGTVFSSAFLKAHAPLGSRSTAYAMMGFSALEVTQTIGTREFSDDEVSFSYGFGLETQLTDRLDLSGDYVRYSDAVGGFEDLSAVSLGLKLYF